MRGVVKKVLVLSGALVAAAAIWSGVGAIASPQSKQSSAGIPARVRALEAKVKTLRVQVADLRGKQACLTALPVSQYGNGTTSGYYFTNDGVTQFLTSALDVTDVGQAPGAYVARIDPACIGSLRAMSKSSYRLDRAFEVTHALK
jgi:hypothetical protein